MNEATKRIADEIAEERTRQIEKEGYSHEHDDQRDDGSIAMAAACYAAPDEIYIYEKRVVVNPGESYDVAYNRSESQYYPAWPWDEEYDKTFHHSPRKSLIIAAALIVAEIERMDRAQALAKDQPVQVAEDDGLES